MRSFKYLIVCLSSMVLLVEGQQVVRAIIKPPVPKEPEPILPEPPIQEPPNNYDGYTPAKATAAGAIGEGLAPEIPEKDSEIDIADIGEHLLDLVNNIISAVTYTVTTTTDGTQTTATITSAAVPYSAHPCAYAQDAYATCSSVYTNFTDLPRTEQAGCLCNAYDSIDFNGYMKSCYNYASSYNVSAATALANGTALCAVTTTKTCAATQLIGGTCSGNSSQTYTASVSYNTANMVSSGTKQISSSMTLIMGILFASLL